MKKAITPKRFYRKLFGLNLRISSMKSRKYHLIAGLVLVVGQVAMAQTPSISDLSLNASNPDIMTNQDLVVTYTSSTNVVETASAWYKDGIPEMVQYLPLEAGPVTGLLDFSGNGFDVTESSNPVRIPTWDATGGRNGNGAFIFDGDDFLVGGNIFPVNSSYTKTAWVNMTGNTFQNIISSSLYISNNHFFKVDDDGTLNAGHDLGTAVVRDATPLDNDRWYFVAVTFDYATGEMVLYKDGNVVDTQTVDPALWSVVDPSVLIGSMQYTWEWEGLIDETRIYDHVLSAEQIDALYSTGNDVIVSEETVGLDEWSVEVTPFSATMPGTTSTSNTVTVHSINVSSIPDLSIAEGASFATFDLDSYVTDYEYADNQLTWSFSGQTDLSVSINGTSHVVTITTPGTEWSGAEDITFRAENPKTDSDSDVATFTVQSVNDAPVLTIIGDQDVDEGSSLLLLPVEFTDADDTDLHIITVESDETNVVVANITDNISGSTYDLVPTANWSGTALITVTVTDDGTGPLSDSETYTLTVNSINDAPVLTAIGDQDVDEDNTLSDLVVEFTDVDLTDSHAITVVSDEGNVTVANISGNITGSTYDLVPAADWTGTALITVTVTDDGAGPLFDSESYTLTVNAINDAPVLTDIGAQSTNEDVDLTGLAVVFTDPDASETYVITVDSDETNVSAENISGTTSGSTYDLVPAANWNGTAQITVTVTDDGTGTLYDTETYTLTVNAVNDAPSSIALSNQVIEERVGLGTVVGLLSTVDVDIDDTHQYELIPIGGTVNLDNDFFIIVGDTLKTNEEIDYELNSAFSILVQSDDGNGGKSSHTFIITVNDLDETSIKHSYDNLSFNVYPIPTIDRVTVEIDNPENRRLSLEIYSNTGSLVYSEQTVNGNTINLSEFPVGVYILSIRGEGVYQTRKIILQDQ